MDPQPLQPREARFHQLVGPRESWRTNLPTWGALYYPGVTRGVDLWFEAREEGIAYSLRAARGADLREVRLEWRGAQALRIVEDGRALEVQLADGVVREEGLRCGQERADGTSLDLPCRYREVAPKGADLWEYVIEVDVKEPGAPAWVDPLVAWNTFVGQAGNDALEALTVLETSGEVFIVGSSGSDTGGAVGPQGQTGMKFGLGGFSDVVATRYNANGTVRWTSVFGGGGDDFGKAIVIGGGGFIYVAGTTSSPDFPNTPAAGMGKDGFIIHLASDGSAIDWVKRVGGTGDETLHSLALGPDGKLYAAGSTTSQQMPGWDGGVLNGTLDFFVSRLDGDTGTLERTLVLSGSGKEEALSITRDQLATTGAVLYVTGYTESADFPLPSPKAGPMDLDGGREAVVLKLTQDLTLTSPSWGTFIGGHGQDEGTAILHLKSPSSVVVAGTTRSSDFPSNSPRPPGANAFLANFDPGSGQLTTSTAVGGSGDDEGLALATGTFDSLYVGGRTTSTNLPVSLGFDTAFTGSNEGFVMRLAPDAGGYFPEWGTYVGGFAQDEVRALGSGPGPDVQLLIGGMTRSSDIFQGQSLSGEDLTYSAAEEMFLLSVRANDLTPPVGTVNDGALFSDRDTQDSNTTLQANWDFSDRETQVSEYQLAVGTAPGCSDVAPFRSLAKDVSTTLDADRGNIPPLTPGAWYFVTIRARNGADLVSSVSSDGVFVLLPDGGPNVIPPPPQPGTPCPGQQPDGGTVDGGTDGGTTDGGLPDGGNPPGPGDDEGPHSPVGWQCGATGGPTGLVLLLLLALGLWGSRRGAGSES